MTETVEVICTLNGEEFQDRRAWVREHITPPLMSIEKTADGLRLAYPQNTGVRKLVEEFAELERQCCGGFLTFSIADRAGDNQFDLFITGPVEVQDMLTDLKQRLEFGRPS